MENKIWFDEEISFSSYCKKMKYRKPYPSARRLKKSVKLYTAIANQSLLTLLRKASPNLFKYRSYEELIASSNLTSHENNISDEEEKLFREGGIFKRVSKDTEGNVKTEYMDRKDIYK